MGVQTLTMRGKGISVRIYFDEGLLHSIEISVVKEVKKVKETIKFDAFPAKTLDMKRVYDLLIIEHEYRKPEDETEVFTERYSVGDYAQNILRLFNEQVGVKYQNKILAGTLSFDEANEYISKFLDYIDIIHTQRRFHGLFEIVKESMNDVYDFHLFP